MPYATTDDGVRLYFEETGSGHPVIFVHEFAGDLRSYEPQMRHFGKRYRAIAFNARGFPPSDVPDKVSSYSQARAADDILAVLDHIGASKAHIVGLSMGGFATLHFGLRHPHRALSLCIGGSGGSGTLLFHGRYYPLAIGGVSYGFTFGASATDFFGTVSNIRWPSDVNGVYVAAGAGAAVGPGGGAILLTHQNGALLTVSGRHVGLIVAADLNGLVITIR